VNGYGKTIGQSVGEAKNVMVNQPISPATFTIKYPQKTTMTDRITNTVYDINSQGQKISAAKPIGNRSRGETLEIQGFFETV
jgi:hypothetical protein